MYALLPRRGTSKTLIGALLAIAALVAFLVVVAMRFVVPDSSTPYFLLFSTIALAAAVRVVTHTRPVYSSLYFVVVVVAVAALLVLLQAEFLAVALIIIYAGAILVTYLFVIMLAQQVGAPTYDRSAREPFLATFAGFVLMAAIAGRAGDWRGQTPTRTIPVAFAETGPNQSTSGSTSNTRSIGAMLMTKYVLVVELSGVLLLVSMIGAISLARRKIAVEGVPRVGMVLGQAGREAKPF